MILANFLFTNHSPIVFGLVGNSSIYFCNFFIKFVEKYIWRISEFLNHVFIFILLKFKLLNIQLVKKV